MSGGIRAIRVVEIGDSVFPGSLDYGLVEVSGVAVTVESPALFGSLEVEFIFGKEFMVVLSELCLQCEILLLGRL
jgi:hypothetical protein